MSERRVDRDTLFWTRSTSRMSYVITPRSTSVCATELATPFAVVIADHLS
jgi:hypothetical protein